ncbi:MAG: hypothetical protein IIW88_05790 [Clostridia bacterium]|nr:hypothetical protein [Clostridia bacterium]
MKKRLLLMLTMMVLMCAVCFGVNAADCDKTGHIYGVVEVAHATCNEDGYKKYQCKNCSSFYYSYTDKALGHDWSENVSYEGRMNDTYFVKYQTCLRKECGIREVEKEGTAEVKYFKVEFFNGQAFDVRDESVTVESYGTTYEIPVKYTVLAEVPVYDSVTETYTGTKVDLIQQNYVKEGNTATFVSKKPIRTKDIRFGEYRFIGWVDGKNMDLATLSDIVEKSNENYKITTGAVHSNKQYYAAWEGVNVTYKTIVHNSDGKQLLVVQDVKHGDSIDYPFSYPTRTSETSCDFVFAGWEMGTKTAAGDKYNFYPVAGAHIKHIPIYSDDAIMAVHNRTPRIYSVEVCDKEGNKLGVKEIAYNSDATNEFSGFDYKNHTDPTGTYLYEYRGYWETEKGHKVYLENFTVPKGSIDFNDPIYLKDEDGNYFKTTGGDNLEIEELHSYYENVNGYFNKNIITYVYPVTEDGEYIVNTSGKPVTLLVYDKGIQKIDSNGNRIAFTQADAVAFRNIKIKPVYFQRVIDRKVTIVTNIPSGELIPEDYKSGLIVQVTNEEGQLLAAGKTKDHKCELVLPKAEIYNITVVSPNEKYYAEKGIVWSVFKAMYDNNEDIIMDLSLNKEYSEEHQSRCRCICHNSFFRGIWVRVLNIMYRLFKIEYVCCYDMYATIGDLLAYPEK